MKDFDGWMERHQTEWRSDNVPSKESGQQNGVRRSWMLPADSWEEGLWPGIRSESANPLSEYLQRTGVQTHRGAHNLKSSWTLCANLYFPFRANSGDRNLFASFLKHHVDSDIDSLESIELEYEDEGYLAPSPLLGEEGGGRGVNQTSPDLGLLVNDGRGLVLVENKFTEHHFYPCSAWKHKGSLRRAGNPDPDRCNHPMEIVRDPSSQCHQAAWDRRYWEHLAPVVNPDAFARLPCCPAARHGYQLLRQQALAEGIAQSGKYELVVSAVAVDERNEAISSSLHRIGIPELKQWGTLFRGRARFAVFTHQQWFQWVLEHYQDERWTDWLLYLQSRYDL